MTDQSSKDPFAQTNSSAPQTQGDPQDQLVTLLAQIKNERGEQKYDSVAKALEALQHSQSYIPQLKTDLQKREEELAAIKAELEKRASVEDVVSRLTGNKESPEDKAGQQPGVASLDPNAVKDLFKQLMSEEQAVSQAKANKQKVTAELSARYGEKVAEVIAEKAKELGTTSEEIGKMASQNPTMVLALFNAKAGTAKPTYGGHNIPPINSKEPQLERPKKSLLSGASVKDQVEYLRTVVRPHVYNKYDIKT